MRTRASGKRGNDQPRTPQPQRGFPPAPRKVAAPPTPPRPMRQPRQLPRPK
ncbi:hypothetical protein [Microbispora sp. NPDC049125]|uniref:hypothetical protein n=1 Tax=Microbispora sp. NPDC049125 TaxID=3154929 RepID=UPI00346680A9